MTDNQQIFMLTVGQLKEIIREVIANPSENKQEKALKSEKRYLYSIQELATFLGVSYPTAHRLKSTILNAAVYQKGRTILIDPDKVLELMKSKMFE